jgi:hypothetical protein
MSPMEPVDVLASTPAAGLTDPPSTARAGELLADRFELERLAGQGGMGAVWRALDRETGGPVAADRGGARGWDTSVYGS